MHKLPKEVERATAEAYDAACNYYAAQAAYRKMQAEENAAPEASVSRVHAAKNEADNARKRCEYTLEEMKKQIREAALKEARARSNN